MNEGFDSWAVVELMGHVRMAGRVTEEERFGAKVGRVDVPRAPVPCIDCKGTGAALSPGGTSVRCSFCQGQGFFDGGFTTVYFGGGSIYRLTPTTEEVARGVAACSQPEPVHRWELPSPAKAAAAFDPDPDDRLDDERDF